MIPALFAALSWGATDALAGVASRRANPFLAALWLHIASLILLAPFIVGSGVWRSLTWIDAALGAGAGVAAAVGDVLFGRSLSRSSMSVGIPLANVVAAAIPVFVALVLGDHLTVLGIVGVVGAFAATGLAALPSNGRMAVSGSMTAVAAGLCFGVMFGLLTGVQAANSLAVVFVMRAAGLVALLSRASGSELSWATLTGNGVGAGSASGAASVAANLLFIQAVAAGPKATVSVVAIGLSAPFGVVIANCFTREKLSLAQVASAASAVVSIGLLAST